MNKTDTEKLRILVVDDEKLARNFLVQMLSRRANVQPCMVASDIMEAAAKARQHQPDVIFLDVRMPGGSGFELLKSAAIDHSPLIIFTTAYPQYAARAFDIQACDYLLKPFDEDRLAMALDRAEQAIRGGCRTSRTEPKIMLPMGKRLVRLAAHEVDWMAAEGNYVRIHTSNERLFIRSSLNKLQSAFQSRSLLRVHRSYVVNIHRIREMRRRNNRRYLLILRDGAIVDCSRRCARRLRLALGARV